MRSHQNPRFWLPKADCIHKEFKPCPVTPIEPRTLVSNSRAFLVFARDGVPTMLIMAEQPGELAALRALLQEGLSLSKQGSYERRLPSATALPKLREALGGLRALVRRQPTAEAWRSLALAEEALLHYPAALEALQQAIALSQPPDRKDLKRFVQVKEYAAKWEAIGLTPKTLSELGSYLETALNKQACDHSHRHTKAWLDSRGTKSVAKVIKSLQSAGGYCDCEVLLNVV